MSCSVLRPLHAMRQFFRGLNARHDEALRKHLCKIYMILSSAIASAFIGCFTYSYIDFGVFSLVAMLISGFLLQKLSIQNNLSRWLTLLSFGFFSGQLLGPWIDYAYLIDASLVYNILAGTFIIFVSLSLSALLAEQGKYLYLGGVMLALFNVKLLFGIANIFFWESYLRLAQLLLGLLIIGGFTLYDTQQIIYDYHLGKRDPFKHAFVLFLNAFSLFRRLLIFSIYKKERTASHEAEKKV